MANPPMLLTDWLTARRITQADFARRLGVHAVSVAKWTSGVGVPRPMTIAAIHRLTNGEVTAADMHAPYLERQHVTTD